MERINSLSEALQYIRQGCSICTADDTPAFFTLRQNRIHVKTGQYSVNLSVPEWKDIYGDKVFWLCDDNDDQFIDPEKDKEYYSWRHK